MFFSWKNRGLIFLMSLHQAGYHPLFALPRPVEEETPTLDFAAIANSSNPLSAPSWVSAEEAPGTNCFEDAHQSRRGAPLHFSDSTNAELNQIQEQLEKFMAQPSDGRAKTFLTNLFPELSLDSTAPTADDTTDQYDAQIGVYPNAEERPYPGNQAVLLQNPPDSQAPTCSGERDLNPIQALLTEFTQQNPESTAQEFLSHCGPPVVVSLTSGGLMCVQTGEILEPTPDQRKQNWEMQARLGGEAGARANCRLAALYAEGKGIAQDYARAKACWEKACAFCGEVGAEAKYNLGVLCYEGREGIEKDLQRARMLWKEVAASGGEYGAYASLALAEWVLSGEDTLNMASDVAFIHPYLLQAFEFGGNIEATAKYALGQLHLAGVGIPRNPESAEKYWQAAAQCPDEIGKLANCALGQLYVEEFKDYDRAETCWKAASHSQSESIGAKANVNLGILYADIFKKPDLAEQYLEKNRQMGGAYGAQASLKLGLLYLNQDNAENKVDRVAGYLKESAAFEGAESARANYELALLHIQGIQGFQKDIPFALECLKKAASFGLGSEIGAYAHYQLGQLYWEGQHAPRDLKDAEKHWQLAAQSPEEIGKAANCALGKLYHDDCSNYALAEQCWKQAIDAQTDLIKAEANCNLGRLYANIFKQYELAQQYWTQALDSQNQAIKTTANANLGTLYANIFKQYDLAEKHWKAGIHAPQKEIAAYAHYHLGLFYYNIRKDNKLAEQFWENASKVISGEGAQASLYLGLLYFNERDAENKVERAMEYLQQSADFEGVEGARANYELGLLYLLGVQGVKKNVPLAVEYLQKACKFHSETSARAHYRLGQLYQEDRPGMPCDRRLAESHLKSALNGDQSLQKSVHASLGKLYYFHLKDYTLAQAHWEKAADAQDEAIRAETNCHLGTLYRNILQNTTLAQVHWQRAADSQHESAKVVANENLARLYYHVLKKPELATACWEKVARSKDKKISAEANYNLGVLYLQVLNKPHLAERALQNAAESEDQETSAQAHHGLGQLYHDVWKKYALAATHWKTASEFSGGIGASAHYKLGILYLTNSEVDRDVPTALMHLEEAAKSPVKGGFSAKLVLGQLYAMGEGVPKNREKAIKHFQDLVGCEGEIGDQARSRLANLSAAP